jgi:hypothetical protein
MPSTEESIQSLTQQVADLKEERDMHDCSFAVEKFLSREFEVTVDPNADDVPVELPDDVEKPIVRIHWTEDSGDRSVGIQGWSGFVLAANQEGTVFADVLKALRAAELAEQLRSLSQSDTAESCRKMIQLLEAEGDFESGWDKKAVVVANYELRAITLRRAVLAKIEG